MDIVYDFLNLYLLTGNLFLSFILAYGMQIEEMPLIVNTIHFASSLVLFHGGYIVISCLHLLFLYLRGITSYDYFETVQF